MIDTPVFKISIVRNFNVNDYIITTDDFINLLSNIINVTPYFATYMLLATVLIHMSLSVTPSHDQGWSEDSSWCSCPTQTPSPLFPLSPTPSHPLPTWLQILYFCRFFEILAVEYTFGDGTTLLVS